MKHETQLSKVKALVFDVFGTVVDWRATVVAEGIALGAAKGWTVNWEAFADEWRLEGYINAMVKVNKGELPWMNVDQLHRRKLDELLARHTLTLTEAEADHFNRVWHRLRPFPDVIEGLAELRKRYVVATLSNGNVSLLTNMARHSGMVWDCILSSELFLKYKPAPEVYQGAAALLGCKPEETLMVASHTCDLEGARAAGLPVAFVDRPTQWGIGGPREPDPERPFDIVAIDFPNLAERLRFV